jgi:SAM-dependent methyltransferase
MSPAAGGASLRVLPAVGDPDRRAAGPSLEEATAHPMREVTRQIAFQPGGWTPERAAKVAALFDGLAPDWQQRVGPGRLDAVADALDRGDVRGERCLELGSGIGFATELLASRFRTVLAADLSWEMLRRAPAQAGTRVWADSARLPVRTASADVVVLINMFLFRAEVSRVLRPGGCIVWVSSLGDRTPIYLPASEVLAALGDGWSATASQCGEATWCVARRAV